MCVQFAYLFDILGEEMIKLITFIKEIQKQPELLEIALRIYNKTKKQFKGYNIKDMLDYVERALDERISYESQEPEDYD